MTRVTSHTEVRRASPARRPCTTGQVVRLRSRECTTTTGHRRGPTRRDGERVAASVRVSTRSVFWGVGEDSDPFSCLSVGTDVGRLRSFVDSYHSKTALHGCDDAFFAFIWSILVQEDDITLAVLEPVVAPPASPPPQVDDMPGREQEGETASLPPVKKGQHKKRAAPPAPTHTLVSLGADDVLRPLEDLLEEHGDRLRVTVSPEASWVAITGSHNRVCPCPLLYPCDVAVGRG